MELQMRLSNFIEIYNTEWWIEWSATLILMIGVALTAWNIYPLNIYFSLAGNFGWLVVGYMWKKWSLIVIQFVVSGLYIAGLIINT
jgi:hypothetical protein